MRRNKETKILAKVIRPYGLAIIDGSHRTIVNAKGQAIYWFSGSPNCKFFADNTLRDLIRLGYIPKEARRKIR